MIVVTGATGRTGRMATETLLARGEKVRAVGRDAKKLAPLAERGAEAFVGDVGDVAAMTRAFDGASAVYLVLPEDISQQDLRAHQERVSDSYAAAISNAHVPFVVNLSSIGAQHPKNTGPIVGLHSLEQIPWIATKDIGRYAATRLAARDFSGSSIQELHGQRDISMKEGASIVGDAISKPNLPYVQVPSAVLGASLVQMGLPKKTAELLVEMWDGANTGLISPQETRSAKNTTPTTLESFVAEVFAPAYLAT